MRYCHICKKGFPSQPSLLAHKKTHNDTSQEDYNENDSTTAKELSIDGSEEYVRCEECSKLFRNHQHLISHVKRSHNTEVTECLRCGKWCKNLSQHVKAIHNSDEILAQAMDESMDGIEGCSSVTEDLLDQSKNKKEVKCGYCIKLFSSKYILDSHIKRIHGLPTNLEGIPTQIRTFEGHKCETCGKRYLNKSGLKRHVKEAHGENRFECKECGQFFPVKHSLERHIVNVHHPTRHTCPICKDISVVHLKAHLIGSSHQMSSSQAQSFVDEAVGKFAARTHLPLDDVIRRREAKDVIE